MERDEEVRGVVTMKYDTCFQNQIILLSFGEKLGVKNWGDHFFLVTSFSDAPLMARCKS